MTVAEQFGVSLRAWRRWSGHSQASLANAVGLHRTHISFLERGKREPRLETIIRLADALGVHPSNMIMGIKRRGDAQAQR